jgi:hypothetical protein
MFRPLFITWFDTQGPTLTHREIVADAMMHSVATQQGHYTKKAGARKRLGEGAANDGAARTKKARRDAPDF